MKWHSGKKPNTQHYCNSLLTPQVCAKPEQPIFRAWDTYSNKRVWTGRECERVVCKQVSSLHTVSCYPADLLQAQDCFWHCGKPELSPTVCSYESSFPHKHHCQSLNNQWWWRGSNAHPGTGCEIPVQLLLLCPLPLVSLFSCILICKDIAHKQCLLSSVRLEICFLKSENSSVQWRTKLFTIPSPGPMFSSKYNSSFHFQSYFIWHQELQQHFCVPSHLTFVWVTAWICTEF